MNICILKESLGIGGTERSAANISKVLNKEHEIVWALYDASNIKCTYSGEIVDFMLPPKKTIIGKAINTLLRDVKLRRLIRARSIDLLFTFTTIQNRQTRYKYSNTLKLISARDFGKISSKTKDFNIALNNSDGMICNSEYIKYYYLHRYPKHKNKVFTVYNYIDTDEIKKQSTEDTHEDFICFTSKHKKTIVSVGRFCKEKGFEYLIEAVAMARQKDENIGLVLVGDGELKQKYLTTIEHWGIQNHVYFTGFQKNPYNYMAKCSCFVLSSISEGFPNVLAEAMALGLPVIATNCYTGPAEILRKDADYDAVNDTYIECDYGLLSPALKGNENQMAISELSKAIIRMLNDEGTFNKYRELSAQRSLDFSEEAAKKKLDEIFNSLQERRKRND